MRVLILTAATGGGHIRAALAVEKYLEQNCTDVEVKVVDALKSISHLLDKTICEGYHFLATKTPKMFGKLYQKSNSDTHLAQFVPAFNKQFSQKLMPVIEEFQPDVIIATHPFNTEMISDLKARGKIKVPLICIMTDYSPHKAWISDRVDAYVVSNEDMISQMMDMGVKKELIYPFGIPVHEEFFDKEDKTQLLKELKLNEQLPTILIMAGSFGGTNILQMYREITALPMSFQIIVITGRNQKLYDAFEKEIQSSPKTTKLVFFTNEVEKYMKASDLLVTKPGGLTVSEALACNVPLAVFDAIPGQEEDNANFLMTHEMAVHIKKGESCAKTIETLLSDRKKLDHMKSSCENFDKSQSIPNLLSLMQKLIQTQHE